MKDIQKDLSAAQEYIELSVHEYLLSIHDNSFKLIPDQDYRDLHELTDYTYGYTNPFTGQQFRGDHKHFKETFRGSIVLRACRVNLATGVINTELDIHKYLGLPGYIIEYLYCTRSYGKPCPGMPFVGVPGPSIRSWLSSTDHLEEVNSLLEDPKVGPRSFMYPDMDKKGKIVSHTYFLAIPQNELAGVRTFSDYMKKEISNDSSSGS